MHNIDLSGKVALVTGGSRGLGRAMALGLAEAGADLILVSRNLDRCRAVAAEVEQRGRRALAVAAHLGQPEHIDALVETAWQEWGRVDLLINNAGINPTAGALTELTPALFQKLFDVNTLGPWYLASRLAPRMGEAGGGVIINVLSVAAIRPPAGQGFYAATKAALKALTAVMAAEWAPLKVRVNALAPGSYHSDLFDQAAAAIPGFLEGARQASLQQRIAATEEIVGPILYLASELSAYTTGATLISDGGLTAL